MASNYYFSSKIINLYFLNNFNRFVNEFILFVSFSILELLVDYLCRTFSTPWSCIRLKIQRKPKTFILYTQDFSKEIYFLSYRW